MVFDNRDERGIGFASGEKLRTAGGRSVRQKLHLVAAAAVKKAPDKRRGV
jgi:hypothetical protein